MRCRDRNDSGLWLLGEVQQKGWNGDNEIKEQRTLGKVVRRRQERGLHSRQEFTAVWPLREGTL